MQRHTVGIPAALYALFLSCVGCASLQPKDGSTFLEPLGGGEVLAQFDDAKDERKICIETARAVAVKGHVSEAILLYEKAELLAPDADSFDVELAPLYAQSGQTGKAITRYQSAIGRGAVTADLYNNYAWTLIETNQLPAANAVIDQGLEKFAGNERLLSAQAMISFKQGDHVTALEQFSKLYGPAAAHHNLAILEFDKGNLDAAITQVQLANQFDQPPKESAELEAAIRTQIANREAS